MNKAVIGILLVLIVGIAGVLVWYSQQKDGGIEALGLKPREEETAPAGTKLPTGGGGQSLPPSTASTVDSAGGASSQSWTTEISSIVGDTSIPNDQAATALMKLAKNPSVPDAQRLEALEHALHLLTEETYETEMVSLVKSGRGTADQYKAVMFSLHGRNGRSQLQTALSLARQESSPVAQPAYDLMKFLVNPAEDLAKDWTKWQAAIDAHLAANP